MAKSKKTEFPYRKSDDKALADGQQVARARYYREVDAAARSLLEELKDEDPNDVDEAIDERIWSASNDAVTYTRDQLEIIMHSDSWLAADDAAEEGAFDWGQINNVTDATGAIAFQAYKSDLTKQVEAHKSDYFPDVDEEEDEENPSVMTTEQAKQVIKFAAQTDAKEGELPKRLGYQEIVQRLSMWRQGDAEVARAMETLHGTGPKGMHWVAVDTYERAARG